MSCKVGRLSRLYGVQETKTGKPKMSTEQDLQARSESKCELCSSTDNLSVYKIPDSPADQSDTDNSVLLCSTCLDNINQADSANTNHWRCLNDSMWTPVPAVQVMAWRILDNIKSEGWPQDLLEMLYLDGDVKTWAEAGTTDSDDADEPTLDSNNAVLNAGDTVTLIKDLVVKGANFTAKRGTVVKNISLTSNPKHIEGRVNGTRIVLVSAFLKKA